MRRDILKWLVNKGSRKIKICKHGTTDFMFNKSQTLISDVIIMQKRMGSQNIKNERKSNISKIATIFFKMHEKNK